MSVMAVPRYGRNCEGSVVRRGEKVDVSIARPAMAIIGLWLVVAGVVDVSGVGIETFIVTARLEVG